MSSAGPPPEAKAAQEAIQKELEAAQARKRVEDGKLVDIENQIYRIEATYLDETAASGGNIIRGFDNYLKAPQAHAAKKKVEVQESDRLFSSSSGTYKQSLAAKSKYNSIQESMAKER